MINSENLVTHEEALLPINHHSISLPTFQGPLDLLLFLIRKNEIDIYDIPIESVTKQYLETLYSLKKIDLELTGEFFVMAATLMVIKSRMLLPKQSLPHKEEEESNEEDPRWELVQQLIEYKRVKEQAEELGVLIARTNDFIPRSFIEEIPLQQTRALKNIDRLELWNTFNKVLQRLGEKISVGEIYDDQVSVVQQINFILKTIQTRPRFLFTSLFPEKRITVNMLLATFLAILELTRLSKLYLEQTENFGDILCISREFSENYI